MNYLKIYPLSLTLSALFLAAPTTLAQTQDYVADHVFTQGIEGPAVDAQGNLYAVNFAEEGTIGIVDKGNTCRLSTGCGV